MEQERLRSVEAGAHAATDPDAPEKAEEIEKLKQGAAATVAEVGAPSPSRSPLTHRLRRDSLRLVIPCTRPKLAE